MLRHGQPVGVLMSARRHAELLEVMEDLADRLSLYEREGVTMNFDKLMVDLGLGR